MDLIKIVEMLPKYANILTKVCGLLISIAIIYLKFNREFKFRQKVFYQIITNSQPIKKKYDELRNTLPENSKKHYVTYMILFDILLFIPAIIFHTKIIVESIISISILLLTFSFAASLAVCFLFQLLGYRKEWRHKLNEWSRRMHLAVYICEVICFGILFAPLFVLLSEAFSPSASINNYATKLSLTVFICAFVSFILLEVNIKDIKNYVINEIQYTLISEIRKKGIKIKLHVGNITVEGFIWNIFDKNCIQIKNDANTISIPWNEIKFIEIEETSNENDTIINDE